MWLIGMDQVIGDLPYELTCGTHVIGRSRTCDLMIRESTLSRQHARIWLGKQGEITVEDLHSKNGTFVNEVRVMQQPVRPKSIIGLGEIRVFVSPTSPELSSELAADTSSAKGYRAISVANLPVESLTPAQRQVFDLIVAGCDELAAAEKLNRSFHTIHLHVQAIFRKLGVHSKAELLALVIQSQHGLPRPPVADHRAGK
jgi:DNA-binding CsgD family transcriptional regulator